MSLSAEIVASSGANKDDIHYGPFRKWLTPITTEALSHEDLTSGPISLGQAFGFLIRRDRARPSFHESMEPPSQATMKLAFTLFDRYGFLKSEFVEHEVRRGSGVWGRELDSGNIVLVETVTVRKRMRRGSIGTKLVLKLLQMAMALSKDVKFAFISPVMMDDEKEEAEHRGMNGKQYLEMRRVQLQTAISFFRALKFRRVGRTEWFALARDDTHPSRALANDGEYDTSDIEMTKSGSESNCEKDGCTTEQLRSDPSSQDSNSYRQQHLCATPLHCALRTYSDDTCCEIFQSRLQESAMTSPDWETVDSWGNSILHVAAVLSMSKCLTWISNSPLGNTLSHVRNQNGHTPLEALKSRLETERVERPFGLQRIISVSDSFDGFDDNSVSCLITLQGMQGMSTELRARARLGCSCGKCLAGFVSPRMTWKLQDQSQTLSELLKSRFSEDDGMSWYEEFKEHLKYVPDGLRPRFKHSKVLRRRFADLFGLIAECLSRKVIPDDINIMAALRETSCWSQMDTHYFKRRGIVAAVVHLVIDRAKKVDTKAGHGPISAVEEARISVLSSCRNDHEFEFVRRHWVSDLVHRKGQERKGAGPR